MRTTGDIERATCSAAHAERFAAGFVLPAHGYESDVAALRAIVSLYSEAALDARRDYFAKSTADLLDWQGKLADAADKLGSAWAWATIRAGSLEEQLAHLGDTYGNAAAADSDEHEAWAVRRAAWLRLVANDVRARLAGAMGRPLPTRSLTPAQEAERLNAQAAAACGPGVIPYVWVACACGALVQSREGAAKTCGACAARPMLDASEPPACVAGAVETAGDAS